ncbi:MAG TPA: SRPBCC family protein, partial [Trebonia sp.]|nr:SRPBCC family protein [Trebonia sp.]
MTDTGSNGSQYEITIDASPRHVLATLRDVGAYPAWQDDITAVEVLRSDEEGQPAEAAFTFNSMGMTMNLTLALAHGDQWMRWSLVHGDFITRNDAHYTVAALDGGRSRLALRQELALKWRMPQSLVRHMVERVVGATMEAVKKRAEETAVPPAGTAVPPAGTA